MFSGIYIYKWSFTDNKRVDDCYRQLFTHADIGHGGVVFIFSAVCLSVFFRMVPQKPMQLGSPNLTYMSKCCIMSTGHPFILR